MGPARAWGVTAVALVGLVASGCRNVQGAANARYGFHPRGTASTGAALHTAAEIVQVPPLPSQPPLGWVNPAVWADVRAFYQQRNGAAAWVVPISRADDAVGVLQSAPDHGLAASDYGTDRLARDLDALDHDQSGAETPERTARLTDFDVRLTTALLTLGRDVAIGRTSPAVLDSNWKARRRTPDLTGTLSQAANSGVRGWLDMVRPSHPEYAALEKALIDLRAKAAAGTIDAATLGAANVTVETRIRQIGLNLERWRWMPDDFGPRYLLVNIPQYHLFARENGKTVLEMRAIVGKKSRRTPVFSSDMTTVIFSPYWNIPDTIAAGETVPAVARDPSYLARNNIEILRLSKSGATVVDPSTVNWKDPDELRQMAFRQRPGPQNALGHVKFLFPNPFNVFLHDTPADELFERAGRALSHGCIRLKEPEALAAYVLRGDPDWDEPRMQAAMESGVETPVKLTQTIPVHVVYFTVWVDDGGLLHFEPDVYGYDAKQSRQDRGDNPRG